MTSGFCIETMLRLPKSYRQTKRLQRDMVAHGWHELLAVPINQGSGLLYLEKKARGAIHRVRRLMSKRAKTG
jgi:hypothetical protein